MSLAAESIRAVVFDLDDTLLRDDLTISQESIEVLRRAAARGIRIIPASGRARDSMRGFVDQIGCAAAYIACNGAECWGPDHRLLDRETYPPEDALAIARFVEERDVYAQTYEGDQFFYNRHGPYAERYARSSMLRGVYVGDLTAYIRRPESKILCMAEPEEILRLMAEAQEKLGAITQVTSSKPYFLEFNPPKATKGNALRRLGERLGFRPEEAVAFGDSLNDLSMLQSAGIGVAMGNAREAVLALIPEHTATNMEDGVARWVREHLLEESA